MMYKLPPIRLPPPPPRRHIGGSLMDGLTDSQLNTVPTTKRNEEGNSEIHVSRKRTKVINVRSQPYYLMICQSLESNISSLPDDIVFDILVQLPAQDIYSAVRPVCRKWYQMIHTHKFVNTHLHHSTYGLLLQKQVSISTQLTFVSLSRQGEIELTRLNYKPEHSLWCSSSNGLILECERRKESTLYISNPVTMQRFSLPRPDYSSAGMGFCFSAIAYASLPMEYKVVRVYYTAQRRTCIILTVGVDKSWRLICTQHLSLKATKNLRFSPLTTEGFVHWAKAKSGKYVLTLNVETEIIKEYPVPSSASSSVGGVYYFSTVKYLSMLIRRGGWAWEVWEMKPETGEWTQLPEIDLEDRMCDIFWRIRERYTPFRSFIYIRICLFPVGWLEYKEVLLYRVRCPHTGQRLNTWIAWNILLKEIEFIKLDFDLDGFFVHRNSLLWLDGSC
ncbi:hypothetical protein CASFOL_040984 [Castilleja foliolosa]|uniref:F-box domain-containing protein n=1 Tax=Castilleja foliolosa TaxID=1961234 RepID=A0ABD3BD76_9LAMI